MQPLGAVHHQPTASGVFSHWSNRRKSTMRFGINQLIVFVGGFFGWRTAPRPENAWPKPRSFCGRLDMFSAYLTRRATILLLKNELIPNLIEFFQNFIQS